MTSTPEAVEQEASSQEVESDLAIAHAVEGLTEGEIVTFEKLLEVLSPREVIEQPPAAAPLARVITEKQQDAIDRVAKVFGSVVPTERRELAEKEVAKVIEERLTLDELKKLAESRTEDIRTIICNHLDVVAEKDGSADGSLRDGRGHYVLVGDVRAKGVEKRFSRELRHNKPVLSEPMLRELELAGELSHEDYLALTTQTRVVDENKVMMAVKKNPELVKVLAKATKPGSTSTALYLRNA